MKMIKIIFQKLFYLCSKEFIFTGMLYFEIIPKFKIADMIII